MSKLLQTTLLFCFILIILSACSDNPTPTVTITKPVTLTPVPQNVTAAITSTNLVSASLTPASSETETINLLKAAFQNQEKQAYRFKVTQKEIINPGMLVTAEGEGSYATNNLKLNLELTVGSQHQQVETLVIAGESWQRLVSLAVWRKLEDGFKSAATLPVSLIDKAQEVKTEGKEQVNGKELTRLSFSLPVSLAFSEKGGFGADALGILSVTGTDKSLAGFTGNATMTVWIDTANATIQQRQLNIKAGDLDYEALYAYRDFGAVGIDASPPANFPRP
ncbi:MAG: hypothetical protein HXX08_24630 [Chloroflexi bacterium]|uniref:Lipoprotein n=1 Tax=Candidatus Chlorohelix allophototropha TaxID=3003348 RepID=A0A8T7MAK2_9CHLR|nr:hypothetical protein [Chloroflexota bacterium]WJW68984.1 hypothetical protein OZ401_002575 [Chloroflexota bacterium L227-S17]